MRILLIDAHPRTTSVPKGLCPGGVSFSDSCTWLVKTSLQNDPQAENRVICLVCEPQALRAAAESGTVNISFFDPVPVSPLEKEQSGRPRVAEKVGRAQSVGVERDSVLLHPPMGPGAPSDTGRQEGGVKDLTSVEESIDVMATAVERGEWERRQTHRTLIPYLEEEVSEFVAAVEAGESAEILAELSDIYLQVLFHAELLRRQGDGDMNAVAAAFVEKMKRRAPYFFDGSEGIVPEELQDRVWQEQKLREKQQKDGSQ